MANISSNYAAGEDLVRAFAAVSTVLATVGLLLYWKWEIYVLKRRLDRFTNADVCFTTTYN